MSRIIPVIMCGGRGHAGLAGLARDHAEAIHPPAREILDLSGNPAPSRSGDFRRADDRHQSRLPLPGPGADEGDRGFRRDRAGAGAPRFRRRRGGRLRTGEPAIARRRRRGLRRRSRRAQCRGVPGAVPRGGRGGGAGVSSSRSASSPPIRRPAMAISVPARWSSPNPAWPRSRPLSKSPTPGPPNAISPRAIFGIPAISSSAPTSCAANCRPSQPEIAAAAAGSLRQGRNAISVFSRSDKEAFGHAPKTSIDYAVMERTKHAAVIPADIGWSDVGNWQAVWELSERDEHGNSVRGQGVAMDGEKCPYPLRPRPDGGARRR